jgi:UDP-N-acetylmuramyl pentapeptide phosphotransferase/UDP-N-acetylglucosamine-1-phosphate transferase
VDDKATAGAVLDRRRTRLAAAAAGAVLCLLAGGVAGGVAGGLEGGFAFAAAAAMTLLFCPVFAAYAMARPNARSSHRVPTPQGGGLPLALTVTAGLGLAGLAGTVPADRLWAAVILATLLIALVGALDDMRPLPVLPRLFAQALAVAAIVGLAPVDWRVLPAAVVPLPVERALLVFGGLWLVNLTNFMDGIDGITVAGFAPLCLALVVVAPVAGLGHLAALTALLLLAGLLAFLPFNWPPARLFLGDVGSLPIGLLAGLLLFDLAARGFVAAAIILPLYHVADATLTLFSRWRRGERLSEAHRHHAYQRAVDGGLPALVVSGTVLGLALALAGLAALTILSRSPWIDGLALVLAVAAVGAVIRFFRQQGGVR